MSNPQFHRRRQKSVVFVGLLLFALMLFFIQIWLFVLILENMLAGRDSMVVPGAAASAVLFATNFWMFRGVQKLMKID